MEKKIWFFSIGYEIRVGIFFPLLVTTNIARSKTNMSPNMLKQYMRGYVITIDKFI